MTRAADLLLLVALVPGLANARGRGSDAQDIKNGFGVELLGVRGGILAPNVDAVVFTATGTLSGVARSVSADGRGSGFSRPVLDELAIDVANIRFRHWFCVGAFLELARSEGDLLSPLTAFGGGVHNGLVWTRSYFDVRVDLDVGLRQLGFQTYALDAQTCQSKGATWTCQPVASALQLFVQPRLRAGVSLGTWVTVGGYAGLDIATGVGWQAGAFVALHAPSWVPDVVADLRRQPFSG